MVQNVSEVDFGAAEKQNSKGMAMESLLHDNDVVIKDHLHFAMHRCIEGAESYANAAAVVSFERQQGFLESLMKAKHRQARELHRYYEGKCYIIDRPIKSKRGTSVTSYLLDVELKPISTLEEAFLFAYKKEHEALDTFRGLVLAEEDGKAKRVFEYLVEQQEAQIRSIERTYVEWKDKKLEPEPDAV